MGRIDYRDMQLKSAVANFHKALQLDPHFMRAYENLGLCYEAFGQNDEAILIYQKAIELNRQQPKPSPWPPLNLGTLLIKLARYPDAQTSLQESLRYDPRFPRAHYQMGLLLEKEKKDQEALRELNLATEFDPTFPEPYYTLGDVYQRLGEKQKADAAWATFRKLKEEKKGPPR